MKLRDYQTKAVENVFKEWESVVSTLVVIPTGGGKTRIAAEIIRRSSPKRVMFLAHTQDLVLQAAHGIEKAIGIQCEIEMADRVAATNLFTRSQIIVSSVQTQCAGANGGRMTKFDPNDFAAVIQDEAHHATAETFTRVINYYRQNPNLRVLGLTATPDRADEIALGKVFESVAFNYEIHDAISDGWLVPINQLFVAVESLDFSHIRTDKGDLNSTELQAVMEDEKIIQGVVGSSIDIVGDKQTILFAAGIRQAEMAAEIFNRHKKGMATWVSGQMKNEDRLDRIKQFRDGRVQILCNCQIATEGFDVPAAECILMARPTKSRSLYAQMIGRGTRPLPGIVDPFPTPEERRESIAQSDKPSMLVCDFVGNSGRHKLICALDILDGNYDDEVTEKAIEKAKKSGRPTDVLKALEESEEERKERIARRERDKQREAERRSALAAKATFKTKFVSAFDVFGIKPEKARGWHDGKRLSDKQRKVLVDAHVDVDSLTYPEQLQTISKVINHWKMNYCTPKQAKILKEFGYSIEVTVPEASKIIDKIAKNGWKRPPDSPPPPSTIDPYDDYPPPPPPEAPPGIEYTDPSEWPF